MSKYGVDRRLSEGELDRLNAFLESADGDILNIEMLDGFFVAAICGPEVLPISECLEVIRTEDFKFESEAQKLVVMELVVEHYISVRMAMQRTLQDPEAYDPILFEEEGVMPANAWASGFMIGVEMRREKWDVLIDDEAHAWTIAPMLVLAHEDDPDPELRPPEITPDMREELIETMIVGAIEIYRYFEPQRGGVLAPIRREGPKVGRNDPCPCGSGRKYKQCCGSSQ